MDELTRLLLDARDGDRRALHAFVRRSQADVWRFCAHLVDAAAADDLTQEVYVRVMRAAPRFRGEASARTWLFTIARRACADEIRRRTRWRRRVAEGADVPVEVAADESPGAVIADEIGSLVAGLDHDRRAAFVLTQVLGFSYAEAAEAEGVPVGTIRSRVSRARADLVVALEAADRDTA